MDGYFQIKEVFKYCSICGVLFVVGRIVQTVKVKVYEKQAYVSLVDESKITGSLWYVISIMNLSSDLHSTVEAVVYTSFVEW